ncbi:MAG: TIGR00341 family protein [Caldilineaceae bacterium]|nr:TIGR00341 family protein [Caldilineaceae bacterium]
MHTASERYKRFFHPLDKDEQEAVQGQMVKNAVGDIDFYVMILLSAGIAFWGLVQNSSAVVIGAMLVAPLMSPMMAIGYAVVRGNLQLFGQALLSTLLGIVLAVGASALTASVFPIQGVSNEILIRANPNLLDLFIAVLAGLAGAYATCRKDISSSLPGVAISVSLVPPLCVVGFGIGYGNERIATNALLLFSTNLAGIVFAGIVVFVLLGFRPASGRNQRLFYTTTYVSLLLLLAIAVPLSFYTAQSIRKAQRVNNVTKILQEEIDPAIASVQDVAVEAIDNGYVVGLTVYIYDQELAQDKVAQQVTIEEMRSQLEVAVDGPVTVRAQVIPAFLNVFERPTLRLREVQPLLVPDGGR